MAPSNRPSAALADDMFGDESNEHGVFKGEPQQAGRTLSSLLSDSLQPSLPSATLSSYYSHSPHHYPLEPPIPLTTTSTQLSHSFLSLPPPPPPTSTPLKQEPTSSPPTTAGLQPPIPLESTSTLYNATSYGFSFPPSFGTDMSVDYTQASFPTFPTFSTSLSAFSSSLPPYDPPLLASPSSHSTASTDSYLATSSLSSAPPSRSTTPDVASSTASATAPLSSPTSVKSENPDNVAMPQSAPVSPARSRPYTRAVNRGAQPATVRRQKHREVDTTRRQKETIAFKKLATLAARRVRVERQRGDEDEEEEGEGGGEDERKAKAKLRVLQDSARKMSEMHTLIERLVDTNRSLVHQLALATNRPVPNAQQSSALALSILPPMGPQLEAAVVSQSLGSTLFLSSNVGQLVVDVLSGSVVDVNDRFMAVTRWERPHLLGRILVAPYDLMTAGVTTLSPERHRAIHSQSVLVEGPDGQLAPARLDEKVAMTATVDAVRALYKGEVDWISVVWRLPLRDGRWYDVPCVNYIGGWVECEDGRRPSTMMFLLYSTRITPSE